MPQPIPQSRKTISAVLPNYNHAKFLPRSLRSIASQTRPVDELIIIDDASTDGSVEIIEEYLHKQPNWRLERKSEQGGVVRRVNEGLAEATGDWVMFMGADDGILPTFVEKAMALAEAAPQAGMVGACVIIVDNPKSGSMRPTMLPSNDAGYIPPERVREILCSRDNLLHGTVTIFRREALSELGGFSPELAYMADGIVMRQLAVRFGFGFIPEVLGFWSVRDDNYSVRMAEDLTGLQDTFEQANRILTNEPAGLFPDDYAEAFDRRVRFAWGRALISARGSSAHRRASDASSLIRASKRERQVLELLMRLGSIGNIMAVAWISVRQLSIRFLLSVAVEPVRRRLVRRPPPALLDDATAL